MSKRHDVTYMKDVMFVPRPSKRYPGASTHQYQETCCLLMLPYLRILQAESEGSDYCSFDISRKDVFLLGVLS